MSNQIISALEHKLSMGLGRKSDTPLPTAEKSIFEEPLKDSFINVRSHIDHLIGSIELNPEIMQLYREQGERLDRMNISIERNASILQKIKSFEPLQVFEKLDSHQKLVTEQLTLIMD